MNKLNFTLIIALITICGCSTYTSSNTSERQPVNKNEPTDFEIIWFVQTGTTPDSAGIFEGDKPLNLSQLSINMDLYDLLAKVNIDFSYKPPQSADMQIFKFPQINGCLVENMFISVGDRHFKAVIIGKDDGEEIYRKARSQGFKTALISQNEFAGMVVALAFAKAEKISVKFNYTQLSNQLKNGTKILFLPNFKGIENTIFNLQISNKIQAEATHLTAINEELHFQNNIFQTKDATILKNGLFLSYSTKEQVAYKLPDGEYFYWDSKRNNYFIDKELTEFKIVNCEEKFLNTVIGFVKFQEALQKKLSFTEIEALAIQYKLLSPLTRLIFVDALKNR